MADVVFESLECRSNDHVKCNRVGWNETHSEFTMCPCGCHKRIKS